MSHVDSADDEEDVDVREEEVIDDEGVDWTARLKGVRASLMEGVMD